LDLRVNVDLQVEEDFLELMVLQDLKVRVVILVLLVYLDLRGVRVILAHQVCLVVRVSGGQQVSLVPLARQVVPVTVALQVLMAK